MASTSIISYRLPSLVFSASEISLDPGPAALETNKHGGRQSDVYNMLLNICLIVEI